MSAPTFNRIPVPADWQVVGADGRITPAWQRFFSDFSAVLPKLASLATLMDDAAGDIEALEEFQERVEAQTAAADETALTISASYSQTEIQALEARVRDIAASLNAIRTKLEG